MCRGARPEGKPFLLALIFDTINDNPKDATNRVSAFALVALHSMPLMLVILAGVRPAVVHAPERPPEITAAYIQR